MYVLYLDEAGTHAESTYFVLAGLAVQEKEIYWYARDLDLVQQTYFSNITPPVEFHSSVLNAPRSQKVVEPFDSLTWEQRKQVQIDIYQILRRRNGVLFGVAIEKAWCRENPYERGFEDLTMRFDKYIWRANRSGEPEQRGVIVVAESSYRRNIELLGERFRGGSTRWGPLHNLADVPFFLPARNTRLLQFADFCANAIHARYHSGQTKAFDLIGSKFDSDQGRVHGLCHLSSDAQCVCFACASRQFASQANLDQLSAN